MLVLSKTQVSDLGPVGPLVIRLTMVALKAKVSYGPRLDKVSKKAKINNGYNQVPDPGHCMGK